MQGLTIGIPCKARPHNRNPLENAAKGFDRKASKQEPFWKAPQRDSIGERQDCTLLRTAQHEDFCWKNSQLGSFGNTTRGFECKALQSESFGKRYERIPLESLRTGTLWTTVPRVSTGMPHTRNMLVSSPSGFCSKASQQAPCGKRYKRYSVGKPHNCNSWATLQTDPI